MQTTMSEVQVSYRRPENNHHLIIRSSRDAYSALLSIWDKDTIAMYEEFKVMYLDRRNVVLGYRVISRGSISATIVDPKIIFSIGLQCHCSSLILSHNHPSGGLTPSKADHALTKKLVKGAKLLEMSILDHLIITPKGYFSFADEGFIDST